MSGRSNHEAKLDRIREVAMTVSEPRTAGEIAESAEAARNTAEKYLRQLVEADKLTTVTHGPETRYRPDAVTQYLDRVRGFIEEFDKAELTAELSAIRDGVDGPDELRASVGDDLPAEERRRRVRDAEDREYFRHQADCTRQAIRLYDSVEAARTGRTGTAP